MTWIKLDDKLHRNPKLLALSDAAHRIYIDALSYCGDVSDPTGFLADEQATAFVRSRHKPTKVITELVDGKLWERVAGGFLIHDFDEYLPKKSTDRVRAWRDKKRAEAPSATPTQQRRNADETLRNSFPHARGDPEPDPVPVPGNASKKATHGVREALSDAVQNGHADDLSLQLARRVSEDIFKRTLSPLEVALCDEFIAGYAYLGVDDIIERMESQLKWGKQQTPPMTPSSLAYFTQSLRVENDHRADAGKPKAWRPPPVAGDLSKLGGPDA